MYDLLLYNGLIFDGSGALPYHGDIGVKDGIIVAIGDLKDAQAKCRIDVAGRSVTPGFFDMHSHADLSIVQYPDAESLLGQGVTTAFCGQCGMVHFGRVRATICSLLRSSCPLGQSVASRV